jgi:hypothetical protein
MRLSSRGYCLGGQLWCYCYSCISTTLAIRRTLPLDESPQWPGTHITDSSTWLCWQDSPSKSTMLAAEVRVGAQLRQSLLDYPQVGSSCNIDGVTDHRIPLPRGRASPLGRPPRAVPGPRPPLAPPRLGAGTRDWRAAGVGVWNLLFALVELGFSTKDVSVVLREIVSRWTASTEIFRGLT